MNQAPGHNFRGPSVIRGSGQTEADTLGGKAHITALETRVCDGQMQRIQHCAAKKQA